MSFCAGPLLFLPHPSCPSLYSSVSSPMMRYLLWHWFRGVALLLLFQVATPMAMLPNSTSWEQILDKYLDEEGNWWEAKHRGKRAISDSDAQLILDLHNKLRGQVYPPASNMEYMVSGQRISRRASYTPHNLNSFILTSRRASSTCEPHSSVQSSPDELVLVQLGSHMKSSPAQHKSPM